MLSDVKFRGEYQHFTHRARILIATGLKLTALLVALPPLVAQAKTAASAHQERERRAPYEYLHSGCEINGCLKRH